MRELPAIPREEYPKRLERLRALMKPEGLAGVLLTSGMNLAYFTGYPSPVRSVSRPFFVILPLSGEAVFFTHYGHKEEAERFSWIKDVRYYTELSRAPVEMIREALRERGILGKNIGMELGFEQTLDISYLEFCRLSEIVSPTKLVDAGSLFWGLRRVKSEAEIRCLREACNITTEAYAATFSRPYASELEIFQTMRREMEDRSGGQPSVNITSGKGNYDLVTKPPDERPLRKGDMVWMDCCCRIAGYWSDFSRAAVIGPPSAEQAYAQEAIHSITSQAVKMVRPGIPASSIARFCFSQLERLPFATTSSIARRAERVGHGVGLNVTELPHISEYDDTPLEPGMVITLEPGVATDYGTFHVEENLVVTSEGSDVLSQAGRELCQLALAD
jgi:Xaa-Pro aminopeptidase